MAVNGQLQPAREEAYRQLNVGVARLEAGRLVRVTTDGATGPDLEGRVSAVDAVVDEATRNVQVRALLPNPGHHLRPGMFVTAAVVLPETEPVVALPASSILYAPYGDSVFIVETMKAPDGSEYLGVRQQVVRLGRGRGDQVAVLSGVAPGDQVVTSGVFKLRNGALTNFDPGRIQRAFLAAARYCERRRALLAWDPPWAWRSAA